MGRGKCRRYFVEVQFQSGNTLYCYKSAEKHEKGDMLVVYTPSGTYEVVVVRGTHKECLSKGAYKKATKWVVGVVDKCNEDSILKLVKAERRYDELKSQVARGIAELKVEGIINEYGDKELKKRMKKLKKLSRRLN